MKAIEKAANKKSIETKVNVYSIENVSWVKRKV